jgi:hypothetical protein
LEEAGDVTPSNSVASDFPEHRDKPVPQNNEFVGCAGRRTLMRVEMRYRVSTFIWV